ncbi:MAG: Ldh family oxidoreductase [Clostridia bacterium]|nr:Ldh family oxidoreductase [Clostridia bacterium]
MSYHYLRFEKLKALTEKIFESFGYSSQDAQTIADVLLMADLFGIESHGVQRLSLYPFGIKIGRIKVDAKPVVLKETELSVVIDADACMGQIVSVSAMKNVMEKAKQHGFGIAMVKNSNHYGIAGYYSLMAANEGLIGVSMTNTQGLVVPTFGKKPIIGTDPIAFSVPAFPNPFHLDMSTSVVTGGKMEVYAKNQKPVPYGWMVDENGETNTDAERFVANRGKGSGGILPLGGAGELLSGYKGFGLAMLVEIMTGIMSGGVPSMDVRKVPEKELCSHMFMAISPTLFSDNPENIFNALSEFLGNVRGSEKASGADRIYIHGEKEFENQRRVMENGVPVSQKTMDEIYALINQQGIDASDYIEELSNK